MKNWRTISSIVLAVIAAIVLAGAFFFTDRPGDTEYAAEKLSRIIGKRMEQLDGFMDKALAADPDEWLQLDGLPMDMVVYRYVEDSLQSWNNQFTIVNDDISSRLLFQVLADPRSNISSPLADIGSNVSFVELGPRWYLAEARTEGNVKVIGGLEISGDYGRGSRYRGSMQGARINRSFRMNDKFSVAPLSIDGGSPVCIDGVPLFTVIYESLQKSAVTDSFLVWIALVLFILSALLYLSAHRTAKVFGITVAFILCLMSGMYIWGINVQRDSMIFSPRLYADGQFLFSLGAVLLFNLTILLMSVCLFLVRKELLRKIEENRETASRSLAVWSIAIVLLMAGIVVYTFVVFRSLVLNSGISFELYQLNDLNFYSLLVYISFITMLMSLPLLLQLLRPALKRFLGWKLDPFSLTGRIVFGILLGISFVVMSGVLSFRKEQSRVEMWANRLSVDRDIFLELQLRRMENSIAEDMIVASLSFLPSSTTTIYNRIMDSYMASLAQNYDISVLSFGPDVQDPSIRKLLDERLSNGTPLFENSHFLYSSSASGRSTYSGLFTYFSESYGLSYLFISVEPKSNREDRGYSSFLGIAPPGRVTIPASYSYARYNGVNLTNYDGSFAYPTVMTSRLENDVFGSTVSHLSSDGYNHFISRVSDEETVIISHERTSFLSYAVAAVFIALVAFMILSLMALSRKRKPEFEKSYFKSRISTVMMLSLVLTLLVLAAVSVYFVYSRNDSNKNSMMTDKITSIQAIVENGCRQARSTADLNTSEFSSFLDDASRMTGTDITLYTVDGRAFMSTTPEIFDRMMRGIRVDETAYYNIIIQHKSYFINKEKIGPEKFYSMYAPLFNSSGQMIAILSSPYTGDSFDFELEAVQHSITILTVFVILLLLARFMASAVLDRLFKPLVEMGSKMNAAEIDNLEYIRYDRDDEITSLVDAYNKMVTALSESSRQLAQAERDKAWNAMARQVAHEIKNPLTPMKLQMQRIIRMKQRDLPDWQTKFDEAAKVVLDHIDILSDTANEFSTFAKLYTEPAIDINLDTLIQEEISMFDNKDNIRFEYMGLDNALVTGPKPQLTRVFVNLITNSVQAIEIMQEETGNASDGRILVSLRNSTDSGYYDIVFEDNGPGVRKENQNKLFTPNFTTKSGGTGIGLAICRSILEKCNAEISYSKSFVLGGACFTIHYPKKSD